MDKAELEALTIGDHIPAVLPGFTGVPEPLVVSTASGVVRAMLRWESRDGHLIGRARAGERTWVVRGTDPIEMRGRLIVTMSDNGADAQTGEHKLAPTGAPPPNDDDDDRYYELPQATVQQVGEFIRARCPDRARRKTKDRIEEVLMADKGLRYPNDVQTFFRKVRAQFPQVQSSTTGHWWDATVTTHASPGAAAATAQSPVATQTPKPSVTSIERRGPAPVSSLPAPPAHRVDESANGAFLLPRLAALEQQMAAVGIGDAHEQLEARANEIIERAFAQG